jgi:hypothetical protein
VLDHAAIWRTKKGKAEDQVLIARVCGDLDAVMLDTAMYSAGFNATWTVIPDVGMCWVVLARHEDAPIFAWLASLPNANGGDSLIISRDSITSRAREEES